ncbi:hypothetical protein OG944_38565 (plasmid) [Streptomyces anulatus]|uniref:hypothetical protein n=1 Tax=Streptomyces anulatus TaxID=1892 RepID=UPI001677FE3B|nr:hypothetical protein [Streptomyces anulatus]WTC68591.1 hypothetical protein OG865_39180 [Streptomyces anulatus]WTC76497.1 hypothetical protein OG882_39705 [Streptomyces anulatus]GGY73531.1 hypothetical protein GCM10010342_71690 [Streptomyces anulatus]
MSETEGTPRALRIGFEFHVPRAVRRNIHGARVDRALDTITERVLGLVAEDFPAAGKAFVRGEWVYPWTDRRQEYLLADGKAELVPDEDTVDEVGPGTPKAMRISFEFEVPTGFRSIRATEFNRVLDAIAERVLGLVEGLFPWASKAVVRKEWLYNWTDGRYERPLAPNEFNTPG